MEKNIAEFNILELETIEAPLTDYQYGVIIGIEVTIIVAEIGVLAAVAAC